jgi:TolB protein
LVVAIVATALLAGSARPAAAASPGRNGLIAFISERHGQGPGIYTMHTDGTRLTQLTGSTPNASAPAFSPDGRTMAFQRDSQDGYSSEVWLAAANGTQLRPLLHDTRGLGDVSTESPAWSPDGRWIAFSTGPADEVKPVIHLVHPDGTGLKTLADGSDPAWSPDGKRIAFDRRGWIRTIGADGRGLHRLHGGLAPAWSPDGRRLAYLKVVDGDGSTDVYVSDANGTHEHRVTKYVGTELIQDAGAPAWSPDGELIAVGTCCEPAPSLDVLHPDGSGLRSLVIATERQYEDGLTFDEPAWSPDGRRIVYSNFGLYVLNRDGSGKRPFFGGTANGAEQPQWSPDGRRIAFGAGDDAWVMNANGSARRKLGDEVTPLGWSPDGRRVVTQDFYVNEIAVIDVAGGRRHPILVDNGMGDSTKERPSWSPEGPIAYLDDSTVSLYVFGRHPPTRSLGFGANEAARLEWSPDGRLLAYEAGDDIWVYDTRTKRRRRLIANASDPAFSPDGRRIAYVRHVTKTNTEIFVARSEGSGEKKITANPGADVDPSWQPVR